VTALIRKDAALQSQPAGVTKHRQINKQADRQTDRHIETPDRRITLVAVEIALHVYFPAAEFHCHPVGTWAYFPSR